MKPEEHVLEVSHISIRFGRTVVLHDLSFAVPAGTTLAILGPNAAKTVLFRALIGAITYEGDVRWRPGTRIGYVPQKLDLERDVPITGVDFLRARAAVALESGDTVSRAFALVGRPNLLLLDEPTAGVDEPGQEQLNELVRRLQRDEGLTVLFISHELSVVSGTRPTCCA